MSLETRLVALATSIGTDIKALRSADGNLATLTTTNKTSLVAALNELKSTLTSLDLTSVINDGVTAADSTYSSNKIENLVSTSLAALVDSAPTTLDTLNELAAALQDNPNFATDIATALGNRVRVDSAQTFTAPEQAQGRSNIGAASASDLAALTTAVGDTDRNFTVDYTTARDAI